MDLAWFVDDGDGCEWVAATVDPARETAVPKWTVPLPGRCGWNPHAVRSPDGRWALVVLEGDAAVLVELRTRAITALPPIPDGDPRVHGFDAAGSVRIQAIRKRDEVHALEWRWSGSAWVLVESVPTSVGYCGALSLGALTRRPERVAGYIPRGGDGPAFVKLDDPPPVAPHELDPMLEGEWRVASTPGGRIAGYWELGDADHPVGPVLVEREGTWVPVEGGGIVSPIYDVLGEHLLLSQPGGPAVVVHVPTAKVIWRATDHQTVGWWP